jgi:hypothetical protein
MMASRGMGAIASSKMPKGVRKARRDDTDFTQYAEGGPINAGVNRFKYSKMPKQDLAAAIAKAQNSNNRKLETELVAEQEMRKSMTGVYADGGSVGLYANINAKRKRIAAGSGEKMRKPGSAGAPTAKAFRQSAKTAKK